MLKSKNFQDAARIYSCQPHISDKLKTEIFPTNLRENIFVKTFFRENLTENKYSIIEKKSTSHFIKVFVFVNFTFRKSFRNFCKNAKTIFFISTLQNIHDIPVWSFAHPLLSVELCQILMNEAKFNWYLYRSTPIPSELRSEPTDLR